MATMESVTGGLLANSISEVPESSSYFKGGVVAFSKESKLAHGVPADILERFGEASQETANAMATAARESGGADFGIGVAGVMGPAEQEGKAPGQIYIAIAADNELQEFELRVPPRRLVIKRRAANTALTELRKMINAGVGAAR